MALLSILLLGADAAVSEESALPGNHPLTASQSGAVLIAERRCAACHSGVRRDPLLEKSAPDLSDVGARIHPDFLQRYIAAPSSAHPGTSMPDLLVSQSEAEKHAIAEALTHFLVSPSKGRFFTEAAGPADREDGRRLFHSIGCVACHGPREAMPEAPLVEKRVEVEEDEDRDVPEKKTFAPMAVRLGHIGSKYSRRSLSEFLFQPLRVRPSGRMPDMKLTPAESLAIAEYLVGDSSPPPGAFVPRESLASKGRQHFQELNCAACHALDGHQAAAPVGSLKDADLTRGCLSASDLRSPRFHLNDPQLQAIRASLRDDRAADRAADSDQLVVARTMTALRCIACHTRDEYGGVPEEYSPFFTTSEKNLGEDGRIPPPLTLVGAKLQPAWLKKVLFDGESVRPYMATRMPQYGVASLGHLPSVVARLDVMPGADITIPSPESGSKEQREEAKLLRTAAQELLGDKGLNCINCHNFNGKPAPVNKGIDLMTTYQRLQPGWFNSFLRNPGALRPRILMPTAWSNGVASHKTILDGNTERQIAAIWYYLSLGTSAADPSGIRRVSTRLSVGNTARIHRGRSRVAGFRGIAVGLPERISYAFNAETGTLSAIWLGDFLGVNWNGQGSGDFNPASQPVQLAQDVSFAQLADEHAAWPLLPVMTKEARTNPNPLYPKNVGYQFRGYFLDHSLVPTFLYRTGLIDIEDRSEAAGTEQQQQLRRVLTFASPQPETVWFRALTGAIRQESEQTFRTSDMRLTVSQGEATLRPLSPTPEQFELLLRLHIPQGQSALELLYEPVRNE